MTRPAQRIRLALFAAAVLTVGATGAQAAETVTSTPVCCEFTQAEYTSSQGEIPQLNVNSSDGAPHNATALEDGPDGKPLFKTATIESGSSPLAGAQYLPTGRYAFECTIHIGMKSTLVVGSGGSPSARPRVKVSIPAQPLGGVRAGGKLKVRVQGVSAASGVSVSARVGRRTLGRLGRVAVAKGVSRIIRIKLTRSGRKALAGMDAAAVTVAASVPSGSPASAKRTLR